MSVLQKFHAKEPGFFPVCLQKNWQVALLNFSELQDIAQIKKLEVHENTDEVFILHKGEAILIVAEMHSQKIHSWHVQKMQEGVIYNVPSGSWHNIAMEKDSSVFIVENRDTHKHDVTYHSLNDEECMTLQSLVEKERAL